MGKYDPLTTALRRRSSPWDASFADLDALLDGGLPPSAYRYPAWWANDNSHVQGAAWLAAGWETTGVDLASRRVMFVPRAR